LHGRAGRTARVGLPTHLAEDADEDSFAMETFGRRTVDQFEEVHGALLISGVFGAADR
jgi:hypothetical protein